MIREAFAVGALILALVAGYEANLAHKRLAQERARTNHLVRILSKRINFIEFWHGWPSGWGSVSEAARDHEHKRESEEYRPPAWQDDTGP